MQIDINKYLGRWYEIAKIPKQFEPNLTNVTADYSLNSDGTINIINSGYSFDDKVSITGIAKQTDVPNLLKVSFFSGVGSDYKILYVDQYYNYAVIGGKDKNTLWILSRFPFINYIILDLLIDIAASKGYNTKNLTLTNQESHDVLQRI